MRAVMPVKGVTMARQAGRSEPVKRYHLKLESEDLLEFAGHMASHVWKEVVDHIPASDKTPELYLAVRAAVERELREHVVGMDLCGLAALCRESAEYDPWPEADELPTGSADARSRHDVPAGDV